MRNIVVRNIVLNSNKMAAASMVPSFEVESIDLEENDEEEKGDERGTIILQELVRKYRENKVSETSTSPRIFLLLNHLQYYPATKQLNYKKQQPAIWHHIYPDIRNYSAWNFKLGFLK